MEKYNKIAIVVIIIPALILSTIVVSLDFTQYALAQTEGGCPSKNNLDSNPDTNPVGRFCGNPHISDDSSAPPIPNCKSPNFNKNSLTCRAESPGS